MRKTGRKIIGITAAASLALLTPLAVYAASDDAGTTAEESAKLSAESSSENGANRYMNLQYYNKNTEVQGTGYAKRSIKVYTSAESTDTFATILKGQKVRILGDDGNRISIIVGPYEGFIPSGSLADSPDTIDESSEKSSDKESPAAAVSVSDSYSDSSDAGKLVPVQTSDGYTIYISEEDAAAFLSDIKASEKSSSAASSYSSSYAGTAGTIETYTGENENSDSASMSNTSGQTETYIGDGSQVPGTEGTTEIYYALSQETKN